jgi:hypothetical protein
MLTAVEMSCAAPCFEKRVVLLLCQKVRGTLGKVMESILQAVARHHGFRSVQEYLGDYMPYLLLQWLDIREESPYCSFPMQLVGPAGDHKVCERESVYVCLGA